MTHSSSSPLLLILAFFTADAAVQSSMASRSGLARVRGGGSADRSASFFSQKNSSTFLFRPGSGPGPVDAGAIYHVPALRLFFGLGVRPLELATEPVLLATLPVRLSTAAAGAGLLHALLCSPLVADRPVELACTLLATDAAAAALTDERSEARTDMPPPRRAQTEQTDGRQRAEGRSQWSTHSDARQSAESISVHTHR